MVDDMGMKMSAIFFLTFIMNVLILSVRDCLQTSESIDGPRAERVIITLTIKTSPGETRYPTYTSEYAQTIIKHVII